MTFFFKKKKKKDNSDVRVESLHSKDRIKMRLKSKEGRAGKGVLVSHFNK